MRFGSALNTRMQDTPLFYPVAVVLFALAMGFAILCVVASYFISSFVLGDEHNAVEHERKEDAILDDSEPMAEALAATAEVMNAVAGYLA
ncbi:transmembrane protein, putative [Rhizoctonia solani AG-3 Rhs1AP]|uniref:Transmembrane protein, putative n=2 Tax=Rhizoctonia solani AG-3 TaxID=1086053 RepID=X8J391_9AGAM|nr:transmembrane protein, putative [Rhizoctonia solani AG-3 Rhs1AP]KEP54491.1 putative transmembrane protein [Rhizoctonia solani 123E]